MTASRPWYDAAFERAYLDVYPHRDLAAARVEIAGLLDRGLRGPLLDLGCGFGRHTLAFAERGTVAFGLDRSSDLLRHSARLAGGEPIAGRLVRGDFRRLPFRSQSFAGLTMLFSSFGYFEDGENERVLDEVARVLRPAGQAVFDLMNAERIRRTLVPYSSTDREHFTLEERRELTDGKRRVVKHVLRRDRDGRTHSWHEDVRLYDPVDIRALLEAHGFAWKRTDGDFDGSPFGPEAARQIVWGERTS